MTDQDRFRRWAADVARSGEQPSELIPAATVVVVRDGDDGLETLMLRRNSRLAFAGGMWVFPGGRVDPDDHVDPDPVIDPGVEPVIDPVIEVARRAAVREAHEEAGLRLDPDHLVPFSHWEPPPITPKRFSTWFFLAIASPDAVVIDDGEITAHQWMRPADALARRDALDIELAPPTWVSLHTLAQSRSAEACVAAAIDRHPERFSTRVALTEAGAVALWHGDSGYEDSVPDRPGDRHRLWMADDGWRYERDPDPTRGAAPWTA